MPYLLKMDFLTHSLVGAGAARLLCRQPNQLPQLSIAAVLGALLIDADPWLYLIDPSYYGFYHRVVTHSIVGMIGVALVSAGIVWAFYALLWRISTNRPFTTSARRFGWYVSPNLVAGEQPQRLSYHPLVAAASAGVALHWVYDVITGFGNMEPFWPLSHYDASLHAVMSFDPVIFSATLGWHILIRRLDLVRRKEVWISLGYAVGIVAYVAVRYASGVRTFI